MTVHTSMLHVRIDDETKRKASEALDTMALPIELRVPNAATRAAMEDADRILHSRDGRFADVEELVADLQKARGG